MSDLPLTDTEAGELLAMCEAATEGPWRVGRVRGEHAINDAVLDPDGTPLLICDCATDEDMRLAAASRDALPRALRTLARVRELLECGGVEGARAVVGVAP